MIGVAGQTVTKRSHSGLRPSARNPLQHGIHSRNLGSRRQVWSIDHDHRDTQFARSGQLGFCSHSARVFADHKFNAVLLHQRPVPRHIKRSTRHHNRMMGQRRWRFRLINQAQHIVMLRLRRKGGHIQLAQRQKHTFGITGQSPHGAVNVRNMRPLISILRLPSRTGQRDQICTSLLTSLKRIPAHLRGKGMRGIHHMGDVMLLQILDQSSHTAKASHPRGQRLRLGAGHTSGVRKHGLNITLRQGARQEAGLGCATEKKEFWRHV